MAVNTDFYCRFPGFQPNPSASAINEFIRLAHHMNWKEHSKVYKREWAKFTASEFSAHYGVDEIKLQNWQALCRELQIKKPIETITKCRKALAEVHVNLVDLIDSRRTGKIPKKFANQSSLRKYTISQGKVFPKKAAKKDGFLKALLRRIW